MKPRFFPLTCSIMMALAVTFSLTACDKNGNAKVTATNSVLTPANVAKLQKGMNRTQVVALFGQPTTVGEVENDLVFKKQTVTYVEGKQSLSVTYKNDEVETFNSTVGTTSSTTTDGQTTTTTTSKTNS